MQSVADVMTYNLTTAGKMLEAFVADLEGNDWLHRPSPESNCAAWLVGHLVLTERRALQAAGATDLPPLPDGFETRFGRGENAPRGDDFGDPTILAPLFKAHRDRLVAAVAKLTPEQLAAPAPVTRPFFSTVGELISFMALHVMLHAGQISTIRRSLRRPPLF